MTVEKLCNFSESVTSIKTKEIIRSTWGGGTFSELNEITQIKELFNEPMALFV